MFNSNVPLICTLVDSTLRSRNGTPTHGQNEFSLKFFGMPSNLRKVHKYALPNIKQEEHKLSGLPCSTKFTLKIASQTDIEIILFLSIVL